MKNLFILAGICMLMSSAVTPTSGAFSCQHKIGDAFEGGIIFSLNGACHGMVCAPDDQLQDVKWDEGARTCDLLVLAGYKGWRMPTLQELDEMYTNLKMAKLGHFAKNVYWSFPEQENLAWCKDFTTGKNTYFDIHNTTAYVRAVRAF
jgi:hypothetical protein